MPSMNCFLLMKEIRIQMGSCQMGCFVPRCKSNMGERIHSSPHVLVNGFLLYCFSI